MQARAEQQRSPVLRPREPFGALDLTELGGTGEPSETFQRSLAQVRFCWLGSAEVPLSDEVSRSRDVQSCDADCLEMF